MDALPQDILEVILDEVDNASLGACALVSHQLLPLCRARIFRILSVYVTVDATGERSTNRCRTLRQLFMETPYLLDYVRFLKLRLSKALSANLDLSWILGKLGRLTDIYLSSLTSPPIDWVSLDSTIQFALIRCIHLPTMRSLHIDCHQGIPISVLIGATSLTRLKFSGNSWTPASPSLLLPHDLVRPTHLQISDPIRRINDRYQFLHNFLTPPCPFSFDILTELDVEVTAYNKEALSNLFRVYADTWELRNLKIKLEDGTSLDLSRISSLESLNIRVDLDSFFSEIEMAHRNFRAMIDTLSTSRTRKLRLIHIYFWLDMNDFPQFPWNELDDALHRIAISNPSFCLELGQSALFDFDPDVRFQSVREQLPRLVDKGVPIAIF